MHVLLSVDRLIEFDAAMAILTEFNIYVWPLELDDISLARRLRNQNRHLSSRDLCHLACCVRRQVTDLMTFDRSLREAFYTTNNGESN